MSSKAARPIGVKIALPGAQGLNPLSEVTPVRYIDVTLGRVWGWNLVALVIADREVR